MVPTHDESITYPHQSGVIRVPAPPLFPAQIDFVQWLLRTTNGEVAGAKDDGTTSAPLGLRSLVFNAHR